MVTASPPAPQPGQPNTFGVRMHRFWRRVTDGLEVSETMLAELRRALLGDLVPPEPVPLAPRASASAPSALATARAYAAQLDPGEHAVDRRKPDHEAHVAQPVRG